MHEAASNALGESQEHITLKLQAIWGEIIHPVLKICKMLHQWDNEGALCQYANTQNGRFQKSAYMGAYKGSHACMYMNF
jgi:hypothetical protein